MITLFHHPFSRAATCVWMLEEVGVPYQLHYVDLAAGAQKAPELVSRNPMGKLPTLTDGDTVVTETAAIGLYLADRYALGRLSPPTDSPDRATYFRWSLFAPSVIEPGSIAKSAGWEYRPGQAGWGAHADMLRTIDFALSNGEYLLGSTFSMADVIFGATLRYMTRFKMLDASAAVAAYCERLGERPALQRADERNAQIVTERGLGGR